MTFDPGIEWSAALRRLLRAPVFSLSVVALLAISIGGVAAIATAAYSLFAQPLPYHQAERLVTIGVFVRRFGMHMGMSPALIEELNTMDDFGRIGIIGEGFDLELETGENLRAARIDHRALGVLGVVPTAGRFLTDDDVRPGAEPVALVSEQLAGEWFESVDAAIGARVPGAASRPRIIGVVPDSVAMPESEVRAWLPMELGPDQTGPEAFGQFGDLTAIGRTRDGEMPEAMQQRLALRIGSDSRLANLNRMLEADYRARPLRELWADGEAAVLTILGLAVGLVLIAAVLNVAGLWMARWFSRFHDLAIQTALGGRQRRLLIGAGIEYLLLAAMAATLAFPIAALGIECLGRLEILDDKGPLTVAPGAITALIGLATVFIAAVPIALALAWQMRGIAAATVGFLSGGGIARRAQGARLRQALMVAQIGIAFSLLLVLGLLLSSWTNLLEEDLGFDQNQLIALSVSAPEDSAPGPTGPDARVAALAERLSGLPGVEAVSWADVVPFGRREMISSISLDDNGGEQVPARPRSAGPGFFELAGIELLQGRRFGPADATIDVQNVIVDQLFADKYLNGDPLGRSFGLAAGPDVSTRVTVVGVVESVRHMAPDEALKTPTVYIYQESTPGQGQLLLRTTISPDGLVEMVRATAIDALGEDRVGFVASLESLVRRTVRDREPQLLLMAVFSGLALILVFYGLYALQSYQVAARTAEFGLRKAIGASGRHILAQGLKDAMLLLLPGLALGMIGGWAGALLVGDRLYSVSLLDPLLWSTTALAIGVVVAFAAIIPALRAARIAPIEALRHG